MREILFRGQKVDTKEWVYGDLLHIAGGCIIYHGSKTKFTTKQNEGSAIELFANEISVVIPETVGQFTGLTDKNGVNIFEGDICFNSNKTLITCPEDKRLYLVNWQDGKYIETGGRVWLGNNPSFIFEKINNDKNYMSLIFNQNQIEVIGNIHDKHVL